MKIAIPQWQSRISPVCDEARRFLIVELKDGQEVSRGELEMPVPGTNLVARVARLRDAGVGTLICGAISRELATVLASAGIQLTSQVCGHVEEVLQAFRDGSLEQDRFVLPGCRRPSPG